MIRQIARRIARERIAPRAAEIDAKEEYPQDIFEVFRDAGLLGLTIPAGLRRQRRRHPGARPRRRRGREVLLLLAA